MEKWVDQKSGQSTGRIKHPGSLLRAVQTLIDRSMVNAIAVVARFPDDDTEDIDDYRQGMVIYSNGYYTCMHMIFLTWTPLLSQLSFFETKCCNWKLST